MQIKIKAKEKAIELVDFIFKGDNKNNQYLINFINESFHYSRYYGVSWSIPFNSQVIKEVEKLKIEDQTLIKDLISAFNYSMKISNTNINTIYEIIKNRFIKPTTFNKNSQLDSIHFLIYYKNYLLSKHLYSSIFHFIRLNNFKEFSNIFESVNYHSVTGKLFLFDDSDDIIFKIPLNKAPCFIFKIDNVITGIDCHISSHSDSLYLIPHFLLLHNSYKKNENFISNIKNEHSRDINDVLKAISKNKILQESYFKNILQKELNYFICFENEVHYYDLSYDDYFIIKMISMEKNNFMGYIVGNNIYRIIFDTIVSSSNHNNISISKKDFFISNILKELSNGNINNFKKSVDLNDGILIDKIILNKLLMIIENHSLTSYKLEDFKYSCYKNKIENEDVINSLFCFFINYNLFFEYFDNITTNNKNMIILFRDRICKSYISQLIESNIKKEIDISFLLSTILSINPNINIKKIKNRLSKI